MDERRIPEELRTLMPLLDEWAIGDDMDRSLKVEQAPREELERLVAAVDGANQEVLYGWLSGAEATSPAPTPEYVAFTCLTMAADEARVTLQQRR